MGGNEKSRGEYAVQHSMGRQFCNCLSPFELRGGGGGGGGSDLLTLRQVLFQVFDCTLHGFDVGPG